MKKTNFKIDGMVCGSCETIIKKQVSDLDGIQKIKVNYATQKAEVTYDEDLISLKEIQSKISEKGYSCDQNNSKRKYWAWAFAILGIVIALYFLINLTNAIQLPEISSGMGYGLLFVVGLLTGFHCISMCGGFVVSYTAKDVEAGRKPYKSHFMYGLGKTVSYTLIGAFFGLLGSIIAFTPMMRGIAGLIAGLFLIIFGLKMLNIFPVLRKLSFKTPKFLNKFVGKNRSSSPLIIGLLNGLMIACGPLQAIYIMAAGTGSIIEGATLLFVFALGTLPVMLGFGFFASLVSSKMTHKILKASGAIVIILGLLMVNNALALTGTGYDFNSLAGLVSANNIDSVESDSLAVMKSGYQEIYLTVDRYGWQTDLFVIEKDVPVHWIINAEELNGCNNAIQVPKLGLAFDL
ncbi:hypothetical protein HN681_04545, partial [archaeon]|nr:hypothetical protein [archaeon]